MEIDPMVINIFGHPPEGIDLSANQATRNTTIVLSTLFISALFLAGRIAIQTQQSRLSLDDYIISVSWLFVAMTAAIVVITGQAGAGKHVWALTINEIVEISRLSYIYAFLYTASIFTTKASILLLYRRIFRGGTGLSFQVTFWFGTTLVVLHLLTFIFTMVFACVPVSHFWTQYKGTEGTCINIGQFFIILAFISLSSNALLVFIPVPEVIKLQMSKEKKATVLTVLALGGLVCIASGIRIHYLITWTKATDTTWTMGSVAIWSSVEASMGIISACLPSFRSYLSHLCCRRRRKNRPGFRAVRIAGKGNRLRSDEEIALRSQKAGESHFVQGKSKDGLVKGHIGQGSERREVFIRTGTKQIVIEIPDAARLRPRVETAQKPVQPKSSTSKPVHVAHLMSKLSPV